METKEHLDEETFLKKEIASSDDDVPIILPDLSAGDYEISGGKDECKRSFLSKDNYDEIQVHIDNLTNVLQAKPDGSFSSASDKNKHLSEDDERNDLHTAYLPEKAATALSEILRESQRWGMSMKQLGTHDNDNEHDEYTKSTLDDELQAKKTDSMSYPGIDTNGMNDDQPTKAFLTGTFQNMDNAHNKTLHEDENDWSVSPMSIPDLKMMFSFDREKDIDHEHKHEYEHSGAQYDDSHAKDMEETTSIASFITEDDEMRDEINRLGMAMAGLAQDLAGAANDESKIDEFQQIRRSNTRNLDIEMGDHYDQENTMNAPSSRLSTLRNAFNTAATELSLAFKGVRSQAMLHDGIDFDQGRHDIRPQVSNNLTIFFALASLWAIAMVLVSDLSFGANLAFQDPHFENRNNMIATIWNSWLEALRTVLAGLKF
mmetsp:Transcript_7256/g.10393  ORF Transcript_7256/g.10393 Transcript_7256/m.10393 type:complete len:430 (-) Transcript_7256:34-1323(-)